MFKSSKFQLLRFIFKNCYTKVTLSSYVYLHYFAFEGVFNNVDGGELFGEE